MSSEFQVANLYVSNKLNASLGRCSSGGELQRGANWPWGARTAKHRDPGGCLGWLGLCCGPIRMICILPWAMPPTEIRDKLGYANTSSTFPQGHSSPWMFAWGDQELRRTTCVIYSAWHSAEGTHYRGMHLYIKQRFRARFLSRGQSRGGMAL